MLVWQRLLPCGEPGQRSKLFRDTAQTKPRMTHWICMAHQRVGVDVNPSTPGQRMVLLSRVWPKECFTEVVVSCWLVWACEVSPADLPLLTKAFLWLFFVWESYFYRLSLFIYICQMSISLSVLVRSQKGNVLAFPTKNLGLHSMVDDRRQLSKDLIHFKLVKLILLCESLSLHCLLCSFIQADSVVCSEQAAVKG